MCHKLWTMAIDFKGAKIDELVRSAYGYDAHDTYASVLHVAIRNGADDAMLEKLLQSGANLDAVDRQRRTPVHVCVLAMWYPSLRFLLEAGADKEAKDSKDKRALDLFAACSGRSELHFEAVLGNLKRCKALVEEGADVNAQASDGATPLAMAILSQNYDVVLLLIRNRIESYNIPNLGPTSDALALTFLQVDNIAAWLRAGISPRALKVEISCLLSLPSLELAHKERLDHVRAFLNHHETLLKNTSEWPVTHFVQQLVSQEPDSVYSVFTHADALRDDADASGRREGASGATTPYIIEWVNKPQTMYPCRLTIETEDNVQNVQSLTYSKCGRKMAWAEDDRVVVYDTLTGLVQLVLTGHKQEVCSVAISEDCELVVSGSMDHTIKIWDAATGDLLSTLRVDSHSNVAADSDPDELRILTVKLLLP